MPAKLIKEIFQQRAAYLLFAAVLVALDRATKVAVESRIPLYETREIIRGFFNLVHTRNTGIAFSLFADSGPFVKSVLIPLFSVAAVALIAYVFWKSNPMSRGAQWGLTLILAGAAGNLYDRFAYGYVVDFLDFHLGSYHWPAFNVADSCITVGAVLLLRDAIPRSREPQKEPTSA